MYAQLNNTLMLNHSLIERLNQKMKMDVIKKQHKNFVSGGQGAPAAPLAS